MKAVQTQKMGFPPPETFKLAEQLFERYNFGVDLEACGSFEYDGNREFRRVVYLAPFEEKTDSQKAWFTIKLNEDLISFKEVYAITEKGDLFGHLPP